MEILNEIIEEKLVTILKKFVKLEFNHLWEYLEQLLEVSLLMFTVRILEKNINERPRGTPKEIHEGFSEAKILIFK